MVSKDKNLRKQRETKRLANLFGQAFHKWLERESEWKSMENLRKLVEKFGGIS